MSVALTTALLAAAPALIQAGTGIAQKRRANQLEERYPRHTYTRPEEIMATLQISKDLAGQTRLPGQDILEGELSASTGNAVQNINEVSDSSASSIGAISSIYGKQMQAQRGINLDAAQRYDTNQGQYMDMLQNVGTFTDKEFAYNQDAPYAAAMAGASALRESGQKNIYSGVSDGAGIALNTAEYQAYLKAKKAEAEAAAALPK